MQHYFVNPLCLALVASFAGVLAAQPPLGERSSQRGSFGPGRGRMTLPNTIQVEKDLAYAGTKNPRQTLDLLLPKKKNGDALLPVIVNIHGGAFRMGDKNMGLQEIVPLVASGNYAGATINYRLSGESLWPAQIHDCKAAIRWLRANAGTYHLDPDRIGVIGGSSGGHLVAMLGVSGGNKDLEGKVGPHTDADSRVQCVVDQFGPTDFLSMDEYRSRQKHNAANSPESQLIGGALQENKDKARAASPLTYVSRNAPPFLILHGTEDPLIPINQSERLHQALRQAGVPSLFVKVEGAGHGGFRNPEVARRIRQFFDKNLRGQQKTISETTIPNEAPSSRE